MARFLVVDDDEAAVRALDALLTMDGHEVTAHTDARAAVAALSAETFDVVLTDSRMPHVGIDQVLGLTRLHQPDACVFIASERRHDRGLEGACRVFEKPVCYDGITTSVAACPARRPVGATGECPRLSAGSR
jgi:two-component system, response regulator FlrC